MGVARLGSFKANPPMVVVRLGGFKAAPPMVVARLGSFKATPPMVVARPGSFKATPPMVVARLGRNEKPARELQKGSCTGGHQKWSNVTSEAWFSLAFEQPDNLKNWKAEERPQVCRDWF